MDTTPFKLVKSSQYAAIPIGCYTTQDFISTSPLSETGRDTSVCLKDVARVFHLLVQGAGVGMGRVHRRGRAVKLVCRLIKYLREQVNKK